MSKTLAPRPRPQAESGRERRERQRRQRIMRRTFMKLAVGAGVTALGLSGRGLILPWFNLLHAAAAAELAEPEVRASRDGLLDTTLTAAVTPTRLAGQEAVMSVYEGTFPGPTLRVRPGDTLRINLVNALGDLPPGLPRDSPFLCTPLAGPGHGSGADHGTVSTCDTNLHLHGLHVSPSGNADNIFLRVPAGEALPYEYQIPANHPAGLYWYHPHLHGTVTTQVFGGMAGALIVEGDFDRLPGIDGLPERLLVLQATQLTEDGTSGLDILSVPPSGPSRQKSYLRLVNGQLNPTLAVRPGETQRWRIANASANVTFRLHLDGHQLHQIAKDGNALTETWTREDVILSPGERAEVLVQAGEAGSYALRTLPIATGFTTQVGATLATMEVAGKPVSREPLPTTLLPLEDLSQVEVDERRRITFQFGTPINPPETRFWINHQQFDPERDDQVVRLNTTEEWVIRNASSTWHPFHIHINDYQVVAYNGQPIPVRSNEDTTGLPPFGEITIRTRFLDYPGRWVYHCHILLHEDHGMMGTVKALA